MKESETRRDYLFLIKLLIYMLFDTFHILNVNVCVDKKNYHYFKKK